jgi:Uma2 family endonuclease
MGALDRVYVKPTPQEREARFLEVLGDGRFQGIGHWELNDDGDVVSSPVSGTHSRAQFRLAAELERQLGGTGWGEQGIRRPDGAPIVPDVLWAEDAFFRQHGDSGILASAPRLCVEIPSPSNDPDALRAKCRTYLALGAEEAWIVDPVTETVEIYTPNGPVETSRLGFDFAPLWARLR